MSDSNQPQPQHKYGWVPDIPDHRDLYYKAVKPEEVKKLPKKVDLREKEELKHFPIYDQGQLGSCTCNAVAANMEFCQYKVSKKKFGPSRLFIYYNTRKDEGSVSSDAGASIRDSVKSVNELGACYENPTWVYDIKKFTVQPPPEAYTEAEKHQALLYKRIDTIDNMKSCLAIDGNPFMFGFSIYESFESQEVEKTGIVPMPKKDEKMLGGHAVLAVGYDDDTQRFIVRNSWGEQWGDKGHFYMPYEFLKDRNLSDDFWTITLMEEAEKEAELKLLSV